MIKKLLICLLFISTLSVRSVRAELTDGPSEQVRLVAHIGTMIGSLSLYTETVREATEYIRSAGMLWENAAMKALTEVSSELSAFQDKLNFSDPSSFASLLGKEASDFLDDNGMKDWREGVEGSLSQLNQEATNAVQTAQNTVGTAVQTVQDETAAAKEKVSEAVGQATQTVKETAASIKEGIAESYSDAFPKKDSDSSAAKVVVVKNNFGQAQPDKQSAQKFIRSRYYYSYKDGDTYMGKPLTNTSEAHTLVQKNRVGYYQEVVTMALATAYEASTSVKEASIERMKKLKEKAGMVKTLDDRRAIEALIVQEETRQRMLRLNMEIALLEKEIVDEMMITEPGYVIARTAEQITDDTKKKEVKEEQ